MIGDWDGNGRIAPLDIGQLISMGLYDEEEQDYSRELLGNLIIELPRIPACYPKQKKQ